MKTNTLESVNLHITPLSPVHIGTGEDYEPTNYVMEDGALFAFDSDIASRVLTEKQRKDLLDMVSKPTRRGEDMIKQVQNFFYNNRKPLAAASSHFLPVSAGVFDLYQKRVGQYANRESGGKSVVNKLEIQRTFFNPYCQQPLIPGSSIKGAIRTALLDTINGGKPLQQVEDRRTQKWRKENNLELQERLMQGKFATDPMRLVNVGDASYQTTNLFGSEVRFAVDRKKKEVLKDGKSVQSQAEAKNLYQLLECLPPLRYRNFGGLLSVQDLLDMRGKGIPAQELRWTMQDIVTACNNFYYPRFEIEMKVLQERRYLDPEWEATIGSILRGGTFQRMKAGKVFLLRVGRHSGAESVTLNGVRSIKILEGKGADGKQTSSYQSEAKTVWLAANTDKDRSGMLPFGWVLVELDDTPDAELQTLLQPWQDKDNDLQASLARSSTCSPAVESPIAKGDERWRNAKFILNKGSGEITATGDKQTARVCGPSAKSLLTRISVEQIKKLVKGKLVATAVVRVHGNLRELIDIEL